MVFDDADLEAAIHGAVAGSLINTGQDCTRRNTGVRSQFALDDLSPVSPT